MKFDPETDLVALVLFGGMFKYFEKKGRWKKANQVLEFAESYFDIDSRR